MIHVFAPFFCQLLSLSGLGLLQFFFFSMCHWVLLLPLYRILVTEGFSPPPQHCIGFCSQVYNLELFIQSITYICCSSPLISNLKFFCYFANQVAHFFEYVRVCEMVQIFIFPTIREHAPWSSLRLKVSFLLEEQVVITPLVIFSFY